MNAVADKLSRLGQPIQTEFFQAICNRCHQPQIYLFAVRFNNKLTQFVSPVPDPLILGKLPGTKGGLSGPKRVPRPLFEQHSPQSFRQYHSCCLHKQGGDAVQPSVCPPVENPDLVFQKTITLKACHIPD